MSWIGQLIGVAIIVAACATASGDEPQRRTSVGCHWLPPGNPQHQCLFWMATPMRPLGLAAHTALAIASCEFKLEAPPAQASTFKGAWLNVSLEVASLEYKSFDRAGLCFNYPASMTLTLQRHGVAGSYWRLTGKGCAVFVGSSFPRLSEDQDFLSLLSEEFFAGAFRDHAQPLQVQGAKLDGYEHKDGAVTGWLYQLPASGGQRRVLLIMDTKKAATGTPSRDTQAFFHLFQSTGRLEYLKRGGSGRLP